MGGPTLHDYREMLSPGLEDLIAEVLAPEGFAGHATGPASRRRGDAARAPLLHLPELPDGPDRGVDAPDRRDPTASRSHEHERLVPGEHCEIRMPVELVECAMHQRRTTWAFDSAEAAADLVPSVRRTLVGAVLPYLEPRRTAERLLASLDAAVWLTEPPSDYQPHSGTAAVASSPGSHPGAGRRRPADARDGLRRRRVPPPRVCACTVRGRSAALRVREVPGRRRAVGTDERPCGQRRPDPLADLLFVLGGGVEVDRHHHASAVDLGAGEVRPPARTVVLPVTAQLRRHRAAQGGGVAVEADHAAYLGVVPGPRRHAVEPRRVSAQSRLAKASAAWRRTAAYVPRSAATMMPGVRTVGEYGVPSAKPAKPPASVTISVPGEWSHGLLRA